MFVAELFNSLVNATGFRQVVSTPKQVIPHHWQYVDFIHGDLTYRSGFQCLPGISPSGLTIHNLVIELPNDEFLLRPEAHFTVSASGAGHWKSKHVAELQPQEVDVPFNTVWSFADWYFGDDKWSQRVLYSFSDQTLDIQIQHSLLPLEITITFQPGYPIRPLMNLWKPKARAPFPFTPSS